LEFYQKYLLPCENISSAPKAIFHYVDRKSSVSHQSSGFERKQAIVALERVQETLSSKKVRRELLDCHRRRFLPTHVLKVVSKLTEHGQNKEAVHVAKQFTYLLKDSDLSGRQCLKASLCKFSPFVFVVLLQAVRILRRIT
jgi:hypothetical protein